MIKEDLTLRWDLEISVVHGTNSLPVRLLWVRAWFATGRGLFAIGYIMPRSVSTLRATRKHSSDCGTPQ